MIYGYARVSSSEQNLDRQLEEFKKYEIDKIYSEKKSGKNFEDRIEYQKLRKKLKPTDDDYLVVVEIAIILYRYLGSHTKIIKFKEEIKNGKIYF